MKRDYLTVDDLSIGELFGVLDLADELKATRGERREKAAAGEPDAALLAGRSVGMIFEKPSTRTRVSFDVAVVELGGHPITLTAGDLQLGRGETVADTARVLSRYLDALVVRTYAQHRLDDLAEHGTIPVINALSDFSHPCQALADLQTIRECLGGLEDVTLAYLGDGNNVAHSLLTAGAMAGMRVRLGCPPGYEPDPAVVTKARTRAVETGAVIEVTDDPLAAVTGADVVYTDVWASMGQDDERGARLESLRPFQIGEEVLAAAGPKVLVMHCLPAHRGEEITAEAMDGANSVVWEQAENRLHTQKALLVLLVADR